MHHWCSVGRQHDRQHAAAVANTRRGRVGGRVVITVGKVRDANYYLAEITSDDAHAYYAGPERSGQWHGSLAQHLGLSGAVDSEEFRALLGGHNPGSGERLTETAVRVTALDVTLSVPKSVSVLWATASQHTRTRIQASLDGAEAAVVALIEAEATYVRRGHAGAQLDRGGGVAAASFDHRTSRLGDPNLHRHVVIANASIGPDDRITGLDTRQLYRVRYTAEAVFQSVLRHELAANVGCRFDPIDRHGVGEIVGVDKAVRDEFSQRRKAIEAEMAIHGATTGRGARVAALTTRPPKPEESAEHVLLEDWYTRSATVGFDPAAVPLNPREPSLDVADEAMAFSLTEHDSTYCRRDVIRHVARAAADGIDLDTIMNRTDRYLDTIFAVELGDDLYTTPEILALESRSAAIAVEGRNVGVGRSPSSAAQIEINRRPHLDEDQQHLVRAVTGSGDRLEVIIGPPGTGKTSSLDAVRAAYNGTSHQLIGAALAARAASELQDGTGIESMTIHRLLASLDDGRLQLNQLHVLVIDEAAMVGTRQLARLINATEHANAKIVLLGDPSQLPAINAGGAFAAIAKRVDPIILRVNRRQNDTNEIAALSALRHGDVDTALDHWNAAGRIHTYDTAAAAIDGVVDAWHETQRRGEESIMVAARHSQIRELNNAARQTLRGDGTLGDTVWHNLDIDFAIGDRVLAIRNNYDNALANGHTATVTGGSREGLTIERNGHTITVANDYIECGHLTHGYAITVHKAQGATVEHAHLLADDAVYTELGYTALSRARHTNHIHTTAARDTNGQPAADPLDDLRQGLTISRAKSAAMDHQTRPARRTARSSTSGERLLSHEGCRRRDSARGAARRRIRGAVCIESLALAPEPHTRSDCPMEILAACVRVVVLVHRIDESCRRTYWAWAGDRPL